jgi:sortase (surface protein transpeptidase)
VWESGQRVLQVPTDIGTVGWDQATARPGAPTGTTLLAGHRDDSTGDPGALYGIATLGEGDQITVDTRTGTVTYAVTDVDQYRKTAPPSEIVSRDSVHRIAVVTCAGWVDGLGYQDNAIVWAVRVPTR